MKTESVRIQDEMDKTGKSKLSGYQILAVPGGFSYGDDIASGKILANEIKYKLNKGV